MEKYRWDTFKLKKKNCSKFKLDQHYIELLSDAAWRLLGDSMSKQEKKGQHQKGHFL